MITFKNLIFLLTILSAVGCGLMAGGFFAFSTFVMKGITGLPAGQGIAVMQLINVAAVNSLFGAAFVITPLICLATIIAAFWRWSNPGTIYLFVGGALYLVGSLLVTIIFNIPLNDTLAAISSNDPNNTVAWNNFLEPWMFWNHVRGLGALAATVSFMAALRS